MTRTGFYQRETDEGIKTYKNVKFESTGVKNEYGKIIWRKIKKDGTPTNVFAEQFQPNMPWAFGTWFMKINAEVVVTKHPELKID